MRSIRARLVRRTTALVVLTMAAAAAVVYLWMRASLLAELDTALLLEARSLASHVEQSGGRLQIEAEMAALPHEASAAIFHFYEMRGGENAVVVRSSSLGDWHLPLPAAAPPEPRHGTAVLPGGVAGRYVAIGFEPRIDEDDSQADGQREPPRVIMAVARETAGLDATLTRLGGLLLVVTFCAATACVVLTGGVIRRGLEPLERLARSIGEVGAANLDDRIHVHDCPAELAPVVACLNDLLGRLAEAMTREKSFTANVAHELRTPLAGLETTLEVCTSRHRDAEGYRRAVTQCLEITRGLHVLVDNLLALARADALQQGLKPESAEVASLLRECWLPFQGRVAERKLRAEWVLDGTVRVWVDREAARRVLTNLFDNAVSYAEVGGRIRTSVVERDGSASVTIANSGCVLDSRDAARACDRFWRGDSARSAGEHCGLGLSLCKKLVELHGGSLTAEIRDGWFFVRLLFPPPPASGVTDGESRESLADAAG